MSLRNAEKIESVATLRDRIRRLGVAIGQRLPFVRDIIATAGTTAPITIRTLVMQRVLGFNRAAYWPMHFTSVVSQVRKIQLGVGTAPGLSRGCYVQAINGLRIGDYTIIGPNVGLISSNHDPSQHSQHTSAPPIQIGSYCLLGANTVILPGVQLGDHTIVAAGAVVSRSFPEGFSVLAGVPAKLVKRLDPQQVRQFRSSCEYIGYHRLGRRSKHVLWELLGVNG